MTVTDKGEEVSLTISAAEKQLRRSGDSPLKGPYESHQVPADDSRQRNLAGHLNLYYDAVIACIGERIAGVETVDKMTNRQIAAKVRRHFAEHTRQ